MDLSRPTFKAVMLQFYIRHTAAFFLMEMRFFHVVKKSGNVKGENTECFYPGDLPEPGIEPGSPALWADSLPSEPPGKSISK